MVQKLIPHFGKSLESTEIKDLLTELGLKYPAKTTCTPNYSTVKGKFEKDGMLLYFTMGGNSRFLKPIPAKTKNSYIGLFSMVEFTKKYQGELPFGAKMSMTAEELTTLFGAPKETEFIGKSTIWQKNFGDNHVFRICDDAYIDGSTLRSITLTFIYEPDAE
jgi:hypothetical protein